MPQLGSRRRGPESLVVGGIALTPHRLFVCTAIGGLVLALALMITFHLTKPKKRKPVLAVDFDEVCAHFPSPPAPGTSPPAGAAAAAASTSSKAGP